MEERPRPNAGSGEVEVGIDVAGICGSDISGFLGHSALRKPPLVMGHELVGRLNDGRRVVANPLISCGRCEACVAGTQNLCGTWRLLGAGQTPGSFAEFVTLPTGQLYEIPSRCPPRGRFWLSPWQILFICFASCRLRPFFVLPSLGQELWGRWQLPEHCEWARETC